MKFDVITIGGITEDIMYHTDDVQVFKNPLKNGAGKLFGFEVGDKILNDEQVVYAFGGGGANAAVSFSRLGFKVALLGAVGTDPSALKIIHHFKKEKINLALLQKIERCWSGLSFVLTAGTASEHVIFTHRAANERLHVAGSRLSLAASRWYYLTSLSGTDWQKNLAGVFACALKRKVKVAWNPGSTQLAADGDFLKKYLRQTEVLILNKEEAQALAARLAEKNLSLKKLSMVLSKLGPKIVGLSDGARGACVYSAGQSYFAKAFKITAVNTTGAGDAFGSSLIGGLLLYDNDLAKSLKLAMLRSGHVVSQVGAQQGLLTLAQVNGFTLN